MKIFAVFDDPKKSVSLNELNQIATLTEHELLQCLDGLRQAQRDVGTGQTLKAIISHFSSPSPRFRRERVEKNVRLIISNWVSFKNWSSGQLSRLCLLTKPDVDSIVKNDTLREIVRDRVSGLTVPTGFVDKLKDCKCNTSQLILSTPNYHLKDHS
ncbi:hypothetical protein K469DRAFT_239109 [Zopfia rhizophila CBS 207.26]|uniref:Uncharacterized protein n=1 Tax=Zopfia rhizophila CBS 207.26 TaxID=1314779 RepID=A0A6A6EU45_9PEZI|nr:hypothetical protein K469DRAFT_239109 [Zopfia rhizophila CBS 207.26]